MDKEGKQYTYEEFSQILLNEFEKFKELIENLNKNGLEDYLINFTTNCSFNELYMVIGLRRNIFNDLMPYM